MKVLMFGWEFPPYKSGGLGTACLGLTKSLTQLGAKVTFVLPKASEDFYHDAVKVIGTKSLIPEIEKEIEKISSDVQIKKIKVESALHPYMNEETYAEYLEHLDNMQQEGNKAKKRIKIDDFDQGIYGPNLLEEVNRYAMVGKYLGKNEDFDVIHAHDWMSFQAAIEAKKISGRPLVVHVHSTEFDRTADYINSEIYCIEKYGMDEADVVVTVSQRSKDLLIHKYNISEDKIKVVYNAVEKDDFKKLSKIFVDDQFKDDKIVLFLGRITSQKGPEYFIKAAHQVLKKYKNSRFIMAGSGDLAPKSIELVAKLGISDRFHFTGFMGEAEREQLFSLSDLYVMPSVSEPFGITPLEAMRHQIPIIISKQSGVGEILDDLTVKIDFWDVEALSASIIKILKNKKLAKDMVEKNSKILDEISWTKSAQQVLNIYWKIQS